MNGSADITVDVAIVGAGIAGAALATVLARDGHEVLLVERQTAYRDKVRGEVLVCWGVAGMLALDLEKPLLDAGGHYATTVVPYDEMHEPAAAEAVAAPTDRLLPGVPGLLDVGHPEACEALAPRSRPPSPPPSRRPGRRAARPTPPCSAATRSSAARASPRSSGPRTFPESRSRRRTCSASCRSPARVAE